MKRKPLLSVVMVTCNAAAGVARTISSVVSQTYAAKEFIVVDGASTDGTVNILKEHADVITRFVSEPDEGIYDAMNKGIDLAEGEFINFMNAGDTFYDADTIEKVFGRAPESADMIYGDVVKVDGERETYVKSENLEGKIFRFTPFCHQALFARRDLFAERKFNTCYKIVADYEFIVRMYTEKKRFARVDLPVARFLMGGESTGKGRLSFHRRVEGLKVLLDAGVSTADIMKSYWFRYLAGNFDPASDDYIGEEDKDGGLLKRLFNLLSN